MSTSLKRMSASDLDLLRQALVDGYYQQVNGVGWSAIADKWGIDPGTLRGAAYATVHTAAQPTSYHDITFDFEMGQEAVIDVDADIQPVQLIDVDAKVEQEPKNEPRSEPIDTTAQQQAQSLVHQAACRNSSLYVTLRKVQLMSQRRTMSEMVKDKTWLRRHLKLSRQHRRQQSRRRAATRRTHTSHEC